MNKCKEHEWGEWEYKTPESCEQIRVCQRCNTTSSYIAHQWSAGSFVLEKWEYAPPESCKKRRYCYRCGKKETILIHDWEKLEHEAIANGGQRSICHRCGTKRSKILVVDDYAENCELYVELLEHKVGYECRCAYSGLEALKKIDYELIFSDGIDLILLDIMMPVMDGYQVCEELRKKDSTKEIPIIFVTAKTEVKDWEHAIFNVGGTDYITKPINPIEFIYKIQNVLKTKA